MKQIQMEITPPTIVEDCLKIIVKLHFENKRTNHERWLEIQDNIKAIIRELPDVKNLYQLYQSYPGMMPFSDSTAKRYMRFDPEDEDHKLATNIKDLRTKSVYKPSNVSVSKLATSAPKVKVTWDDLKNIKGKMPESVSARIENRYLHLSGTKDEIKTLLEKLLKKVK